MSTFEPLDALRIKRNETTGEVEDIVDRNGDSSPIGFQRLQRAPITVDAITAVDATALGLVGGETIIARDRSAAGDGGGGTFDVQVSAQVEDGGLVFDLGGGLKAFREGWTVLGFNGELNIKWFGAKSGIDSTAAIQSAIDSASAMPSSGCVFVPDELFSVSQIVIKSYVALKGPSAQNGWARLATFNKGSVIKALDGSGLSPVKIQSPSTNWAIQDLVIDGNKANQTAPGVHCIEHRRQSATGSPGGVIKGVKCVNPTGFGAYIQAAHPLEISECFFMSGLFLGRTFDTLVRGCSIDGTDSKHPALWSADSEHISIGDNFIFRGEEPSGVISQEYTVDAGAGTITVEDDSDFYDGMPVALATAGTYPDLRTPSSGILRGADTFLVKKMGANVLRLYYRLDADYAEATARVGFNSTGVGTQYITSGIDDIVHVTRGFHVRITDSRVAGSPGGGATIALSSYCQYTEIDHWALNYNNGSNNYGVTLLGSQWCTVGGALGDSQPGAGLTLIRAAVVAKDDQSNPSGSVSVSESNKIAAGAQLQGTQGIWFEDLSTATYRKQNQVTGWIGESADSTQRVVGTKQKRRPGVYYYSAATSTASIPTGSNTSLTWAAVTNGNTGSITNGSTISVPDSARSLLNVSGKIGFSNRPTGAYYILLLVTIDGTAHRFLWEQQASASTPTYIVVPFSVSHVVGASDTSVTVQVFQNSGSSLTLAQGVDYTQMCITKQADYVA